MRDGDVSALPEDLGARDAGLRREARAGAAARAEAERGEEAEDVERRIIERRIIERRIIMRAGAARLFAGAAREEAAAGAGVGPALRALGPLLHRVEEDGGVEHAQLVAADERGGAAARAVEVVGDAAGGAEHVELRGEGLEHELDAGGSVRARRGPRGPHTGPSGAAARVTARDARLDAMEVPGGRARAPDLARRSSFML